MVRKLVCSCVVAAVAATVGHGATTLDLAVGDSVAVVVRPDRYAEDPGAGFPIVLLSDASKATSEIESFADRYDNAVLVCAGNVDRAGLLAGLSEDRRLYAFPRGRTKGHCHPRASSAKTRGFHTQLDEGPETP